MASPAEIRKLIQQLKQLADTSSNVSSAFDKIKSTLGTSTPLLQSQVQALSSLATKSGPVLTALTRLSKRYDEVGKKAKEILSYSKDYTKELAKQASLAEKLAKSLQKASKAGNQTTNAGSSRQRRSTSSRRTSNKPTVLDTSSLEKRIKKQTELLEKILKNDVKYYSRSPYYRKQDGKTGVGTESRSQRRPQYLGKEYSIPGLRGALFEAGNLYETLKRETQFEFSTEREKLANFLAGTFSRVSKSKQEDQKSKRKKGKGQSTQELRKEVESQDTQRPTRGETLGSQGIEGTIVEVGRNIVDALLEIRDCMNCGKLVEDPRLKGTGWRRSKSGQTASQAEVDREMRRKRLFSDWSDEEKITTSDKPPRKSFFENLKESSGNLVKGGGIFTLPFAIANEALSFMVKLLDEMARPIKEISTGIGASAEQADKMSKSIRSVFQGTRGTVASVKDLQEVVTQTVKTYDGLILKPEYFEGGIAKVAELAKYAGISSSEMSQLSEFLRRQGDGESAELAANFTEVAIQAAEAAGIAPGMLTRDVLKNAGRLTAHFAGAKREIIKGASEIRKMGYTLDEAFALEDNLLDFEKSTQAALEASVALGRSIDFTAARTALLEEGPEGMLREIRKLMSADEFENLGYAQRRIFADMLGMPVDEVQKKLYMATQDFQESTAGAAGEARDIIDGKETESIMGRMNQYFPMDEIRNSFDKLKRIILDQAGPSIQRFGVVLSNAAGSLESRIAKVIGSLSRFGAKGIDFFVDAVTGKIDPLKEIRDLFKEHVIDPLADYIQNKLFPSISASIGETTTVLFGTKGETEEEKKTRKAARSAAFDAYSTMPGPSSIGIRLLEPLIQAIDLLYSKSADGGEIKDGIVQNGRIITTHPQDYIMAIKDPSSLTTASAANDQKMAAMELTLKDILSVLRASKDKPSVHYIDFGDGAVEKLNSRLRLVNTNYA
jgi:ABC-type transporter Mla subunit MlaD